MAVCVVDSNRTLIWGPKRFRTDPSKPFDIRAELSIEAGDVPVLVQDRGGAPVVGADVRAVHRREERTGTTDTQGRFVVTGWTDDLVDLIVRQPCHGLFVRWNLAVPPPGQPIRVTLPQDLTVSVRVVDWTGLDVPEGRLTARIGHERIPGEEAVGSGRRDAHGCRVLTGLPPRPVTLVATVSGREFEQVHDPRLADHSTITLPGHGSITLSWRLPLDRALEYTLTLSGKFVGGGSLQRPLTADEVAASEIDLPVVFEGRYRAQIFGIERTPEKVSWRVALENNDIEVTAQNRTRAMLAPH
jgi:hypothetical protein